MDSNSTPTWPVSPLCMCVPRGVGVSAAARRLAAKGLTIPPLSLPLHRLARSPDSNNTFHRNMYYYLDREKNIPMIINPLDHDEIRKGWKGGIARMYSMKPSAERRVFLLHAHSASSTDNETKTHTGNIDCFQQYICLTWTSRFCPYKEKKALHIKAEGRPLQKKTEISLSTRASCSNEISHFRSYLMYRNRNLSGFYSFHNTN